MKLSILELLIYLLNVFNDPTLLSAFLSFPIHCSFAIPLYSNIHLVSIRNNSTPKCPVPAATKRLPLQTLQ